MPIQPGQTLLQYRLDAKIGEGGMGVVWKATDTSLNRQAAIKVLPEAFASDPDRVGRFEREARFVASLSHPNVAGIYGTHEASGYRFLAMEFVEGEDLAQLLSRGSIPRDEALEIALQIARGLEAAHDSGVIHRDLKPANVKLAPDGSVKVLDFGLAKAFLPESSAAGEPSMSPTVTSAGTMAGVILGTASYMSPEQAKGKEVDRRADIWSFGVLLFELLTGRSPFQCESVPETLAAVMMREVDLGALPADTPGQVKRLLRRCLQRDPQKRLRDIGDARLLLEEAKQAPETETPLEARAPARAAWITRAPWAVAAAAVAVAVWLGLSSPPAPEPTTMRFSLSLQSGLHVRGSSLPALDVSPDGKRVVMEVWNEDRSGLYLREMGSEEAEYLDGTEWARSPIFSPDGQWIAFAQDRKLKKISVSGGPPATLCEARALRGASWGRGGRIVLAPGRASGLMLVPDSGGELVPLTELEPPQTPNVTPSHRWPEFLPDGKTVLFTRTPNDNDYEIADIVAVSVADGTQKVLVKGGTFPRYVPTGFLTFLRQNTLFAARFSPERVELLGPPVPVVEEVAIATAYGSGHLSFSDEGVLAYLKDSDSQALRRLVWFDRQGNKTPASAHERNYGVSRISPDGRRAVLEITEAGTTNLWMLDISRDSLSRFTFDELVDRSPVWSPDGEWIYYSAFAGAASSNLFRKRSNGTGEAERLTENPHHQNVFSISPNGKILLFEETSPDTGSDILLLRLAPEPREPEVYLRTPFDEAFPRFSNDGAWIAYASNETGQPEVYVRPFDGSGGQVKVSSDGGILPVWSPDGTELFYSDIDTRKMMAVPFSVADGEFAPETARELLDLPPPYGLPLDVAGKPMRILTDESLLPDGGSARPAAVVVHWFDELERKVPPR